MEDFRDEEGFLRCGGCGERKELMVDWDGTEQRKVRCLCPCALEERDREERGLRAQLEGHAVKLRKERCFSHREQWSHTFANDDGSREKMKYVKNYAENWEEVSRNNVGLLLTGGVGTGKSYAAACVANFLCENGHTARMLNLSEALNGLFEAKDKTEYLRALTDCALLVIDDFGIQRGTDYAAENVFNIIDGRCRSGRPLIVTTNLSVAELKGAKEPALRRICDRILELCVPVVFDGPSRRQDIAKDKLGFMRELNAGQAS